MRGILIQKGLTVERLGTSVCSTLEWIPRLPIGILKWERRNSWCRLFGDQVMVACTAAAKNKMHQWRNFFYFSDFLTIALFFTEKLRDKEYGIFR